ncbi:MAG: glycosyltransferase [Flavobacteriales bacterium]|nr:glycosyltransferase [Flavobacteriales bacterium]
MALRIAIISPNRQAYSETFITDLIAGLQGEKLVLIDGALPTRKADGTPLLAQDLIARLGRAVRQQAFGATTETFQRESVTAALRAHRTQVVIAEYGPTAAAMFPVCKAAGIPLVAHFHGVDAYHQDVLAKHATSYPKMLKGASAVIGVSKEMVRQLVSPWGACGAHALHQLRCGSGAFPGVPPGISPARHRCRRSLRREERTLPHAAFLSTGPCGSAGGAAGDDRRWPAAGDVPTDREGDGH